MNSSLHFSPLRAASRATGSPLFERRRRALAVGFLLVWPAFYGAGAHGAPLFFSAAIPAPMTLRVGKSVTFPLARGESFSVERGGSYAQCEGQTGAFSVRALSPGLLVIRLQNAAGPTERIALRFVEAGVKPATGATSLAPNSGASSNQSALNPATPVTSIAPVAMNLSGSTATTVTRAPNVSSPAMALGTGLTQSSSPAPANNLFSTGSPSALSGSPGTGSTDANQLPPPAPMLPRTTAPVQEAAPSRTTPVPNRTTQTAPAPLAGGSAAEPQVERRLQPAPPRARPLRNAGSGAFNSGGASRISPVLLAPTTNRRPDVGYRFTPRLPQGVSRSGPRPGIEVTQGLARLVSFPENILSVFFSDPNVMDARAINARTIAVTGAGAGTSTLAVFTSRYPGDAVGRANIYRVQTSPRGGSGAAQTLARDPQALEAAITAALGDPRIRATVMRLPDGSLAAQLQGVVRNAAEVTGATSTAEFYVPRVVSSLYADVNAPSIDAVRSGVVNLSPTDSLQDSLRRLTGNSSIELVTLPTGLALKAATNSPEEAEAILRILPSLNQPIMPFIVVRGLANSQSPYYNSDVPLLQGEDRQLTDKLQLVTGVRTVYAVRASSNSVAIYGNVRTRGDYEAVKRFGLIIAQQSTPIAVQGTGQGGSNSRPLGVEAALPAYDPAGGYARPLNVQMFVRILDPSQATVRNVTVETNVVEISRTALKNLGVQFGSASVLTETRTPGTVTVLRDAAGNPVIDANGNPSTQTTPGSVTRSINPSLQQGVATIANGFIGGRPFQFLDPFRAQLTALSNRGDARILARPNVSAMEGMSAQITIGGERPVPSAVASFGSNAQNIEFRRYGVIISMRPTVSDDNTIILQIRADITQPDRTFEINVGGALIPGESVRSVDTTLAVRPGDIIVMGGLMTNEKRQQTSKVPILGDLPIIGALFKSKRYENNETELAIFMTPRIDFLPASPTTLPIVERGPSLPQLPSRQDGSGVIFQNTTRTP